MQETQVQTLGPEDLLEKGMGTYSSILAPRIAWTEEPGGLQSMESQSQTRLSDLHFHFQLPFTKLPLGNLWCVWLWWCILNALFKILTTILCMYDVGIISILRLGNWGSEGCHTLVGEGKSESWTQSLWPQRTCSSHSYVYPLFIQHSCQRVSIFFF